MEKTAAAAEIDAVTVKLPTFWKEQPQTKKKKANTKFDHGIASLDATTAANVSDVVLPGFY